MRQSITLMLLVLLLGVSFQTLSGPMPDQEVVAAPAPWLGMGPAREIPSVFKGSDRAVASLEARQAAPLSLASEDFDEDGVPDVVSGYKFGRGGIIGLRRGNVDAIYPNAPEARERRRNGTFVDAPFLPETRLFETPQRPDFLGAGDFDADGHLDVVAASRAGRSLKWHRGDGKGEFGPAQTVGLPGTPTALVTGEINRRDGLEDIVVAVDGPEGQEVLVFEAPEGALKRPPEQFGLPGPATSLVLAQMDEQYAFDLLTAAGDDLVLVRGRDRKLSLDEAGRSKVRPATVERVRLPFGVKSLAVGDFDADRLQDVALMAESGALHVTSLASLLESARRGPVSEETLGAREEAPSAGDSLVRVNASGLPGDDLLVVDRSGRRLLGVMPSRRPDRGRIRTPRVLPVEGEPLAILPMRLDSDALDDLVVLEGEPARVSVMPGPTLSSISVSNVADAGPGSLRQAILEANATAGADLIRFNISGPVPHTIHLSSPLPAITDSVTIDGWTEPDFVATPIVELDGTDGVTFFDNKGFDIFAPNTTIRGLVMNRFHLPSPSDTCDVVAIMLEPGSDGSIIEGNFLGTDPSGLSPLMNDDGIGVHSANNRIGGTTPASRNLISANDCRGVSFFSGASGTTVQGNLIGTNVDANTVLDPSLAMVVVSYGVTNTTIGGTAAGARNVIASNGSVTVNIADPGTNGHLVQGNFIGIDGSGASALGARGFVSVGGDAADNTIGGTSPAARNVIVPRSSTTSGGKVVVSDATGTLVQGNFIGTNATGTASAGSIGGGVVIFDASGNTIGGSVPGARNLISGNLGSGISLLADIGATTANLIAGNYIGTNVTGTASVANTGNGVMLGYAVVGNTIGGATPESLNLISGNGGSGIRIEGGGSHLVQGNYLGTNAAGTAAIPNLGDGVIVIESPFNRIGGLMPGEGNLISGNTLAGLEISGGTATDNFVRGNKIGTDATGTLSLGNGVDGIRLSGPTRDGRIESNVIAFNGGGGILAFSTLNNLFVSNSIFSNSALGIDLEGDGVTINDPDDPDTGSNTLQNFPDLDSVTTTGSIVVLRGSLDTLNPDTYNLQFFKSPSCDPSGHGEGRTFLGSLSMTAGFTSPTPFDTFVPGSVAPGEVVTATASSVGRGTSEFSACFTVGGTAPGAVDGMRFDTAVPQTLAWDAEPGASLYHLYVGTAATQSGLVTPASDACEAAALPETSGTLPPGSNPPPGHVIWFLVTAANGVGEGPLQPASSGPRILNSTGPCGDSCAHSNCSAGGPLDPACSLCTGIICAKDPHCCDPQSGSWDLSCVQQMRTVCRSLTCPESEGLCAHSLCDADGGPLSPGCDTPPLPVSCTAAVCQVDPHCCQQAWDEACIARMETVCGYSCI